MGCADGVGAEATGSVAGVAATASLTAASGAEMRVWAVAMEARERRQRSPAGALSIGYGSMPEHCGNEQPTLDGFLSSTREVGNREGRNVE